ncbi:MAG TPA: metallophosphoesterase [Vicinamibacterales bacterium]|nr:metallophosphoesterase [Vicinamibacterales bacterium]
MAARYVRVVLGVLLGTAALAASGQPARPTGRIVAVGDIHGAFEQLSDLLERVGLTDGSGAWTAGSRATFVQTGDFTDRGSGVQQVMDLLMSLEERASAAGGRAYVLLGNHEAMNLLGETRDVTPEIFATFADAESERRREDAWRRYERHGKARAARLRSGAPSTLGRDEWMAAHPPGFLEYRTAMSPSGRYGRWLRERPAVLQLGETIFLHGGIHPQMAPDKIEDLNKQVQREIRQFDEYVRHMTSRGLILPFFTLQEVVEAARAELQALAASADREPLPADLDQRHLDVLQGVVRIAAWALVNPNGPLWFRGFGTWTSAEGAPQVAQLLEKYHARRFVVGHTVLSSMRIQPRFERQVYLIDTGMLSTHYKGGRPSALEISGDRITAIYDDGRNVLAGTDGLAESASGR